MKPLVTVITPTTGNAMLYDAVVSVHRQTYSNIQHIVVIDGPSGSKMANNIVRDFQCLTVQLPFPTGKDNYNGHRIYGAMSYIAEGDYLCFLDEDNWYDPEHIESLVEVISKGNTWAYSLRKIVDRDKNYICNDDCESLGKWKSVINDYFVDVGCFMIPKSIALSFSPGWYRRARHPQEQPEVDRLLTSLLLNQLGQDKVDTSGQYTLNYRVANRADSVQAGFFLNGNERMKQIMNGTYPWRKKT